MTRKVTNNYEQLIFDIDYTQTVNYDKIGPEET